MSSYNELINDADKVLEPISGYSEARYYMNELCDNAGINLYSVIDEEANTKIVDLFKQGIDRLSESEPVSHVLGYSYFYGRKFIVNGDVLIPRNETEQLVMNALVEIDDYFGTYELDVVDIATGSGAIGITLKLEEPMLQMSIADISHDALLVAKTNADKYNLDIEINESDMLQKYIGQNRQFDVIMCNPPYINTDEQLDRSVKDYEPHVALFGGADGLDFYRQVLIESKTVLKTPGLIGFEIGYDQKENLSNEIRQVYPSAKIKCFQDYAGLDRMIFVFV